LTRFKPPEDFTWQMVSNVDAPEFAANDIQQFDDETWTGRVERISLDREMQVFITKAEAFRDFTMRVNSDRTGQFLRFNTFLSGGHDIFLPGFGWHRMSAGKTTYFRPTGGYADFRVVAGDKYEFVGYSFSIEMVRAFLGDDVPPSWRKFLADDVESSIVDTLVPTPDIMLLIHQIARNTHVGRVRNIQIEGLALQALASNAALFQVPVSTSLTGREEKKIALAREFLLHDMRCPPTLAEMAKEVGLGARKLSQGFKELYGDGPFSILKDHRLDQARLALLDNVASLKEVSWQVGYGHVSNFSNAYKERFGVNPSEDT